MTKRRVDLIKNQLFILKRLKIIPILWNHLLTTNFFIAFIPPDDILITYIPSEN